MTEPSFPAFWVIDMMGTWHGSWLAACVIAGGLGNLLTVNSYLFLDMGVLPNMLPKEVPF